MTREELQGQYALDRLSSVTPPRLLYIGGEAERLYALEEKRSEILKKIAHEWARIAEVDEKEFWTRSMPQVLFDTLNNYQTETAVVAAEEFLKKLGWTITRPEKKI